MPITNIINPENANKEFTSVLKNKKVLCLNYWKNCGHCIDFIPIWNKVLKKYRNNSVINIVTIELESIKNLKNKDHKVMAFPSLIIYENGKKKLEYVNQRTEKNLEKFIKENFSIK